MLPGASQEILPELKARSLHDLPHVVQSLRAAGPKTEGLLSKILGSPALAKEWSQVHPDLTYLHPLPLLQTMLHRYFLDSLCATGMHIEVNYHVPDCIGLYC